MSQRQSVKWNLRFDNVTMREAFLIGIIIHMKTARNCPKKCWSCNFHEWALANLHNLVNQ